MRYEQKENIQWRYNTDAGIKFRGITPAPNPFARIRGSYSTSRGEWRTTVAQSLYWFNTLGLGETTQLDLERIISTLLLFRASSNATWLHNKQNFDLRQDLAQYCSVSTHPFALSLSKGRELGLVVRQGSPERCRRAHHERLSEQY